MPPTLDLSSTTHSKMLVSPPRINLRRAASYNHDKGPLSSTSSRFNFNHLVFSPPPSPGLPSLSPPPKKSPKGFKGYVRPRRVARLMVWIFGAVFIFYIATSAIQSGGPAMPVLKWSLTAEGQYEMVGQEELPEFPTPVVVTDRKGKARWTISIPPSHGFPLRVNQYADMCAKCKEVSAQVKALRSHASGLQQTAQFFSGSSSYDHYFVDVREAEEAGLLPGPAGKNHKLHKQSPDTASIGEGKGSAEKPICQKSMTFVLESTDAGIGNSVMMLWTAYGVALKEGRAFFVDDTRWAYGKYSDVFQPPPIPGCQSPPKHEMLPCPRQARHLVVSAATSKDFFGDLTAATSTGHADKDRAGRRTLFHLARHGYEALFKLKEGDGAQDAAYVDDRTRTLMAKRIVPRTRGKQNGVSVGLHVRRGDRHPLEYQYRDSYIPIEKYAEVARDIRDDRLKRAAASALSSSGIGGAVAADDEARQHSFFILASDDPLVYEADEFRDAFHAQDYIQLASKAAIQAQETTPGKFVDDTFGWEGGFFAAMFWNFGTSAHARPNAAASPKPAASRSAPTLPASLTGTAGEAGPSEDTLRLRGLMGRAYMMDLAVLADASDVVVCTVSAAGCRLLAVMMGWESAVENGNWVNIDGGYEWTM